MLICGVFSEKDTPHSQIRNHQIRDDEVVNGSEFSKPLHEYAPVGFYRHEIPNYIVGNILDNGFHKGDIERFLTHNKRFLRTYGSGNIPPEFLLQRPNILFDQMSSKPGLKRETFFRRRPQGNVEGVVGPQFPNELKNMLEANEVYGKITNVNELEVTLSKLSQIFNEFYALRADPADYTRLCSIFAMLEACHVYMQNMELYRLVKNPNAKVLRWGDATEHPVVDLPLNLERYPTYLHEDSAYIQSKITEGKDLVTYWFTFDHDGYFFAEQPTSQGASRKRLISTVGELEGKGLLTKDTMESDSLISIRKM